MVAHILSRIMWGARISLTIGIVAIGIAMVIGTTIGLVAGYFGGKVDIIVMQANDVLLAFPSLILGLIVVAMLGPSVENLIIAIALTAIPPFARIARAPTIAIKEREFIEAGRALGYFRSAADVRACPAEHPAGSAGHGLALARHGDPRRGLAGLHRPRRQPAHTHMGRHDPGGLRRTSSTVSTWSCFPRSRSSWSSSPSTCSATGFATPLIRA